MIILDSRVCFQVLPVDFMDLSEQMLHGLYLSKLGNSECTHF